MYCIREGDTPKSRGTPRRDGHVWRQPNSVYFFDTHLRADCVQSSGGVVGLSFHTLVAQWKSNWLRTSRLRVQILPGVLDFTPFRCYTPVPMAIYTCQHCGDDFTAKPSAKKKFCGPECYNQHRYDNRIVNCQSCGVECGKRKCNDCLSAEMKEWKANNREHVRQKEREYRQKNKHRELRPHSGFKVCTKCGDEKHLDEFDKNPKNTVDGKRADCKECRGDRRRERLGATKREVLTDEQRRERRREREMRKAEQRKQEYLAKHGVTPLCACGCGVRVGFSAKGEPNKYAGRGHQTRNLRLDYSKMATEQRAKQREEGGYIPLDDFIEAVRGLKEKKQMTWKELAEKGGISREHLGTLIYKKTSAKSVSREWATNFFRRLADLPAPLSGRQERLVREMKEAVRETESRI